jgi:hypothetical protein
MIAAGQPPEEISMAGTSKGKPGAPKTGEAKPVPNPPQSKQDDHAATHGVPEEMGQGDEPKGHPTSDRFQTETASEKPQK